MRWNGDSAASTMVASFRTRQYDSATGSWLQEDPTGLAGGVNLHEYNGNDPNSFRDPFGTSAELCPNCDPRGGPLDPAMRAAPWYGDPLPVLLGGVGGTVRAIAGVAEQAITSEAAAEIDAWGSKVLGRILREGEDVTYPRSIPNFKHPITRSELGAALAREGFTASAQRGGSILFVKDATSVSTYLRATSTKGPSALIRYLENDVAKIRLGGEP